MAEAVRQSQGACWHSLALPETSNPNRSMICPAMYVILNTVASTEDQNPTVFVDGEICKNQSLPPL